MKTNKKPRAIKLPRTLLGFILGSLGVGAAASAQADIAYDNLGATSSGADQVLFRGPLFDSFTATSDETITGLEFALGNLGPPGASGALTIGLYSFSDLSMSAVPTLIATLGTINNSAIATGGINDYAVSLLTDPALTAGMRYWIGLTDYSVGGVIWSWSSDTSGPGVAGDYWAYGGGVVVSNSVGGPYQMALTVVPTVPDRANAFSMLALCAPGLPSSNRAV